MISARTMRNASKVFVYVKMGGMAMDSIALTIVRPSMFGASIDVCQSLVRPTKTNVSEWPKYNPKRTKRVICVIL